MTSPPIETVPRRGNDLVRHSQPDTRALAMRCEGNRNVVRAGVELELACCRSTRQPAVGVITIDGDGRSRRRVDSISSRRLALLHSPRYCAGGCEVLDSQRHPMAPEHRLPDADGDVARSPIPPVLIWRFARVRCGGDILLVAFIRRRYRGQDVGQGLHLGNHRSDRRAKDNARVFVPASAMALHGNSPAAKHVVGGQHWLVVEEDLGDTYPVRRKRYRHARAVTSRSTWKGVRYSQSVRPIHCRRDSLSP